MNQNKRRFQAACEQMQAAKKKVDESLQSWQQDIHKGNLSDNPAEDLVVSVRGLPEAELIHKIEGLSHSIKKGEPVLVIATKQGPERMTIHRNLGPNEYAPGDIHYHFALGVAEADGLVIDPAQQRASIPARKWLRWEKLELKPVDGPLLVVSRQKSEGRDEENNLVFQEAGTAELVGIKSRCLQEETTFQVIVGKDQIETWFAGNYHHGMGFGRYNSSLPDHTHWHLYLLNAGLELGIEFDCSVAGVIKAILEIADRAPQEVTDMARKITVAQEMLRVNEKMPGLKGFDEEKVVQEINKLETKLAQAKRDGQLTEKIAPLLRKKFAAETA